MKMKIINATVDGGKVMDLLFDDGTYFVRDATRRGLWTTRQRILNAKGEIEIEEQAARLSRLKKEREHE